MSNKLDKPPWAIRPQVPNEVYTDRQEFIDYFYHAALEAIPRRTMSTVLLGQRRMGKTEIFIRTVNRLFFEQDHRDPQAVVPVYYSFPEEIVDRWEFAINYVENFIRWYAAFRLRNLDLISPTKIVNRQELPNLVQTNLGIPTGLRGALNLLAWLQIKEVTIPEQASLNLPRSVSDRDDISIVMFLDEFQNTHLPQHTFRVVGFMQQAVESNTCPHFVTGSAVGILTDILGRFMNRNIEALTDYYGEELALKTAAFYGARVERTMAPIISERCGGNPFYITALIRQAMVQQERLDSEETLNELLAIDISSGFIWAELNDQVTRWIERINEYGLLRHVKLRTLPDV